MLGRVHEYFLSQLASAEGTMVDRVHRELSEDDVARIAGTYHAWRGDKGAGEYADVPGFCKVANLEEIRKHGHVLTPRPLRRGVCETGDGSTTRRGLASARRACEEGA